MTCIELRAHEMVAVGTALAGGPRTDPSVRNYRTGLLPWVRGGEARLREWVHGAGLGYPPGRDAVHPGPVDPGSLAAVPQRRAPVPDYLGAEGVHRIAVAGHGVVSLVPAYHGGQPSSLVGDGQAPAPPDLGFHLGQLGPCGRSTLKWPHCSPLIWPHRE